MHINKVFLIIFVCAMSLCCGNETLIRNTRTIPLDISSSFAWPRVLGNLWPNRHLWEWPRDSVASLVRLIYLPSAIAGSMHIEFGPEDGQRASVIYQKLFGYRGQWLIKQLGKGLGSGGLMPRQPTLNPFLTPPLPPFRSSLRQ